jgi:twinkle protein
MSEINGFEIEEYNIYNIPQNAKYHTCPNCSHDRKPENTKQKCLSVFWDTGLGQCNHCGSRVQLHTFKKSDTKKE